MPKGRGQEHGILSCEDFDDLIWEEEVPSVEENTQWMAVVKVHTSKGFSQSAFFDDMRAAWSLARDIRFRILGANPFTVQFQTKVADIVDQFEEGLTPVGVDLQCDLAKECAPSILCLVETQIANKVSSGRLGGYFGV